MKCLLSFWLLALALPSAGHAQDELPPDSVAVVVFEANLLADLRTSATLHYRYDMSGDKIEQPFTSHALMRIEATGDGESKEASFELFEGPNKRQFGPIHAASQNPMILVFLQRDVTQMSRLTGGSAGYFQQGLRHGFRGTGEVEKRKVEVAGETVEVKKISIRPFESDPQISRFPQFRDKTYSFWVGDDVPGGLYRVEAVTPDPKSGTVVLAESFTFDRIEP